MADVFERPNNDLWALNAGEPFVAGVPQPVDFQPG